MTAIFQDVHYGLRQLRKSPVFTLTVVLTLALGIGANSAVFTLFDQVLLRMLPVERPKELVRFQFTGAFQGSASSFGGDMDNYFSYPMYRDLRDRNQVFTGVMAADRAGVGVSWHNQAEDEDAELVTGNAFQLLGLKPALGRLLTPQDDTQPGANPVVVLSYSYWKSRFAGDRGIVGQSVLINGHPFMILGVAPPNFESAIGGSRPGVFLPLSMAEVAIPWMAPRHNFTNHQSIWLTLVARLKPGVTRQQAEASLQPLWHSLRANELTLYPYASVQFKKSFLDESHLKVLDDSTGFFPDRMDMRTPLMVLMGMAGLLVAMCAINVATLLLIRAAGRVREMSMRYALGARRVRILRQLLIEGGMLGAAGAAGGLVLAPVVAAALVRWITNSNPGSEPYSTAINVHVLVFTATVALLASLLFSMAPAIQFLRPNLTQALRQNATTATRASQRFRKLCVGAQISLSVLLLGGAGLFVRTLANLRNEPVGFQTSNLLTFTLDPTISGYGETRTSQIVTNVLNTLQQIPGVTSAAATTDPELAGDSNFSNFTVQNHVPAEGEKMTFEAPWITPGYFATLRQPLLAGRGFTASDTSGQPKVAVVNLAFAERFFGSAQKALGRSVADGNGPKVKPDTRIVGVVGDVKHRDLRTGIGPAVYRPYLQLHHPTGVQVYVHSAQPPDAAEPQIRQAVHRFGPALVVDGLRSMENQVSRSASDERALAFLAVGFSLLAMLLAAVGLYGVLAYSIEQRTREIGVRLALGSGRWSIASLVVTEMIWIAVIATAVALPSVAALARLFRSELYGVAAFDPVSLIAAAGLTAAVLTAAAILPARRAAAVEPMQALRTE